MTTLADRALTILHDWVQSESLRKHCYAVADSMKHFATLRGADVDLWEAVGLLHVMDYERNPNHEERAINENEIVGLAWLCDHGLIEARLSANLIDATIDHVLTTTH